MLFFSIRTAITQKIARNTLESDSFKSRIRNAAEAKSMKKGSIVLMTNITLSNATFLGIQKTYSRRMLGLKTREFLEETGLMILQRKSGLRISSRDSVIAAGTMKLSLREDAPEHLHSEQLNRSAAEQMG